MFQRYVNNLSRGKGNALSRRIAQMIHAIVYFRADFLQQIAVIALDDYPPRTIAHLIAETQSKTQKSNYRGNGASRYLIA